MKLFTACLIAETNSFAACPTGLGAFEEQGIRRSQHDLHDPMGMLPAILAIRQRAQMGGIDLVEGLVAAAQPLGPVVHSVYIQLRDEIIAGLAAAYPVDGVLLLLHGSMSSDVIDDCEGDLLSCVRDVVGLSVPVGVALDLHCHLTRAMIAATPLIIAYKEYPHTDIVETVLRAYELTTAAARKEIQPTIAVSDCHMMGLWPTINPVMADYVNTMRAIENRPGVLSVSLGHGMAYADVPEADSKTWVITDGDELLAKKLAAQLAHDLFDRRDAIATRFTPLDQAIDQLCTWTGERPLALVDVADNPGGGAMGDSTFILRALLDRGLENIVVGALWDPGAVRMCQEAGVGATFHMRLGGKSGKTAGDPVDVSATVMCALDEHSQDDFGSRSSCGASAWVRTANNIDVVLISRRQQVLGTDLFTGLGIDISATRGLVVKSMQHFLASFSSLVGDVVHVETPGLMRTDFDTIPYARRSLAYWPRVSNP